MNSPCARESRLQGGISHAPDLKPSENKINRSRENELYPGPAVGERCDLIGGKSAARPRAADGVAPEETILPALLFVAWTARPEDHLIYLNSGELFFL